MLLEGLWLVLPLGEARHYGRPIECNHPEAVEIGQKCGGIGKAHEEFGAFQYAFRVEMLKYPDRLVAAYGAYDSVYGFIRKGRVYVLRPRLGVFIKPI